MKTLKKFFYIVACLMLVLQACKEGQRFEFGASDTTPPDPVTSMEIEPLHGGLRILYTLPGGENNVDVIAVKAECAGRTFASSFYRDTLEIWGLAEQREYTVNVYVEDRSGNRSTEKQISGTPLESVITQVERTIDVKGGFSALVINWKDSLEQPVNVFVEYSFNDSTGKRRDLTRVFSSNEIKRTAFVENLKLKPNEKVAVKVSVGDTYGNRGKVIDKGEFTMLTDKEINHFDENKVNLWSFPQPRTEPPFGGGVTQVWGTEADGETARFIDGIIDIYSTDYNYLYVGNVGNIPSRDEKGYWNFLIDLGDYYELSRMIVHGRHGDGNANVGQRGKFYTDGDIGICAGYYWDEVKLEWVMMGVYETPWPDGTLSDLEWYQLGIQGHTYYLYQEDPQFSPPVRWFRFEARHSCARYPYTDQSPTCLSEIRLFSKPK